MMTKSPPPGSSFWFSFFAVLIFIAANGHIYIVVNDAAKSQRMDQQRQSLGQTAPISQRDPMAYSSFI